MLVTLNTDGSLEYGAKIGKPKRGGWAFWISSDAGRFKRYGRTPDATNTMGPELVAIAKGIHFIRNHEYLKEATKIIINTDCEPAINWVSSIHRNRESDKKHKGSLHNVARHHILRMIKRGYNNLPEVKIEFRHVKAHTKDLSEARKWVNNWLDKKAKEGRKMKLK